MAWIAIVFTAIVGLLIVWQFLAEKGRKNHILRGLLIFILSIPPAILNTYSIFLRGEKILDSPSVMVHIVLGSLFYFTVLATIFTGFHMIIKGRNSRRHKVSAYSIIVIFVIMFLVPMVMRIL